MDKNTIDVAQNCLLFFLLVTVSYLMAVTKKH